MSSNPNQSSEPKNQQANTDTPEVPIMDPLDLVEQQLEQQPTVDPEELTSNPAISPQMLNEGDNLRGDLIKEE